MLWWNFISTYHFWGMMESSFRADKENNKKTYRRNSVNTPIKANVNFQLSLEFCWKYRPRHRCVSWPFPTNQGKIHPFPTHKLDWWGNYASRVVRLSRQSSILNCLQEFLGRSTNDLQFAYLLSFMRKISCTIISFCFLEYLNFLKRL